LGSPGRRTLAAAAGWLLALGLGCVGAASLPAADPLRYRLADSGTHWDVSGADRVLEDLQPRYPEFFAVVLDPAHSEEPNLLELRDDLEREPASRRNYDALNALAIGYFEINYRAGARRGEMAFISGGFRAAKIAAVPWRAYGELEEGRLRDAILDFFADAARGEKLGSAETRGRLTRVVESLARKEQDPARLDRIETIAAELRAASELR
jgi:hypothetical protein